MVSMRKECPTPCINLRNRTKGSRPCYSDRTIINNINNNTNGRRNVKSETNKKTPIDYCLLTEPALLESRCRFVITVFKGQHTSQSRELYTSIYQLGYVISLKSWLNDRKKSPSTLTKTMFFFDRQIF